MQKKDYNWKAKVFAFDRTEEYKLSSNYRRESKSAFDTFAEYCIREIFLTKEGPWGRYEVKYIDCDSSDCDSYSSSEEMWDGIVKDIRNKKTLEGNFSSLWD